MAPEVILILQFPSESGRAGPCDRCIVRQKDRCSLIEEFLQTEIVYNDHLVSLREVGFSCYHQTSCHYFETGYS